MHAGGVQVPGVKRSLIDKLILKAQQNSAVKENKQQVSIYMHLKLNS